MSIQANFPAIKPTLLLDFANTEALDPRITYSRASTGTYYDGKTVAKAEENLLLYSQAAATGAWSQVASILTNNATAAPDGTVTAFKEVGKATTGYHGTFQGAVVAASTAYTVSVYAKASEYTKALLANGALNNFAVFFDLTAGTVISTLGSGYLSSSISNVGNGWYRLSATFTTPGTLSVTLGGYPAGATLDVYGPQYTGDGTSGVFLWGAQLEQRSFATAYTPTTTAPITNYIPVLQTASAGTPRFDHNPITGESLGLLIEEQRTNLLLRSEEFDNAAWVLQQATITANVTSSPDGTITADKLAEDNTTAVHRTYQSVTKAASAIAYAYSTYVKAAERTTASVFMQDSVVFARADIDLTTGVLTNVVGTASATSVGNGWWRVSVVGTSGTTTSVLAMTTSNSFSSFAGVTGSGIYIWGAQLEAGAFATSYIPTVASQVTRAADSASMTGTNFSSWYNQSEGTLYAESSTFSSSDTRGIFSISSSPTNYIDARQNISDITSYMASSSTQFAFNLSGTYLPKGFNKITVGYKTNNSAASVNATVLTDSICTVPVVDQLSIGNINAVADTYRLNGTIKKLTYYPQRLSNTQLQALTS